jgi:hypothetical protein
MYRRGGRALKCSVAHNRFMQTAEVVIIDGEERRSPGKSSALRTLRLFLRDLCGTDFLAHSKKQA